MIIIITLYYIILYYCLICNNLGNFWIIDIISIFQSWLNYIKFVIMLWSRHRLFCRGDVASWWRGWVSEWLRSCVAAWPECGLGQRIRPGLESQQWTYGLKTLIHDQIVFPSVWAYVTRIPLNSYFHYIIHIL